jgi:hypothetical protein
MLEWDILVREGREATQGSTHPSPSSWIPSVALVWHFLEEGGLDRHDKQLAIGTDSRQLRDVTRDSLAALQVYNVMPSLFIRAGKPVCVHKEESGRHIIAEATDRIIRNRLTRLTAHYRTVCYAPDALIMTAGSA